MIDASPRDEEVLEALREALAWLRAQPSVRYAECRWVAEVSEGLAVRDGQVEAVQESDSAGFGVRVVAAGAWGFASISGSSVGQARRAAERALAVARASAVTVLEPVRLAELAASRGRYETPVAKDPFEVGLDAKIELLIRATEAAQRGAPEVRRAEAKMSWVRVRKALVTTDGTEVVQRFVYGGAGLSCVAVGDDGRAQRRSLPASMDGEAGQGGYERVEAMDLLAVAERAREESVALLKAPALDARADATVILDGTQLADVPP